MPGSADFVQRVVHAVGLGAASIWLRRGLIVAGLLAITTLFLYNFRGLTTSQAMDQAQIGRAIASGRGWQTNYARPLAIEQLQSHGKDVTRRIWVDTYNAPLPPLVNAIALFPIKSHIAPTQRDQVGWGDRAIALLGILLFFGAIAIQFFIASRLFDQWLALLSCSLVLICNTLWQYTISGLPQMLLLFLFNATLYALVRAIEANYQEGKVMPWLVAVGAGFGLLALTHGLTIWMFVGVLFFISFSFRPRGGAAAVVLAVFLALYGPWLLRNWIICGNPLGLAFYSALDGIGHSEMGWMRQVAFHTDPAVTLGAFRDKVLDNIASQTGRIFEYLGWSVVAMGFFFSSLHLFKRAETSAFRWMLLVMWAGTVFGMAIFGINEEQGVAANQLHLLFIPLMTCYGLAWLLVQWNRLDIPHQLARTAFIVGLFICCGFPLGTTVYKMLLGPARIAFRWPPYIPIYINVLNNWMNPEEITASDMPWAVAWYADRRSILVPETVKALTDLSDYNVVGGPIAGLYLTPISGSDNKLRDITTGEYKEWAPAIQLMPDFNKLPFKWGTLALGFDRECSFLSDHSRGTPQ